MWERGEELRKSMRLVIDFKWRSVVSEEFLTFFFFFLEELVVKKIIMLLRKNHSN